MKVWRYLALMGVSLFPVGVLAQEQCADAPQILSFADTILADRTQVNNLQLRRIGAEAAYLKIVYGHPDAAEVNAMFDNLLATDMPDALELLATYTIAQADIDNGLRVLDPDPVRAFSMAGRSVRRAIFLADSGESYFSLLRSATEVPDLESELWPGMVNGTDIMFMAAGQPDETLLEMSQNAEAAGFVAAAAILAADMTSLDTFRDVTARHPDDPYLSGQDSFSWLNYSGATLRHNTGPIPRPDLAEQIARAASDAAFYATVRAMYLDGFPNFSTVVVNQTGLNIEGALVANAFVAEVEAGRLDPQRDPEAAWLFQYRAWAALIGRDALHGVVGSFDLPSFRIRHFAGSALQSLDWMLAKEALRPYLAGETEAVPTRPALLSDEFDWKMWVSIAGMLDSDFLGIVEAGPAYHQVALELLADAGRYDEMQALAGVVLEPYDRLNLLRDVMQRLDRKCAGWMVTEGGAMFLGGDSVFRF